MHSGQPLGRIPLPSVTAVKDVCTLVYTGHCQQQAKGAPEAYEQHAEIGQQTIMPAGRPWQEAQQGVIQRAPEDLPMALCPPRSLLEDLHSQHIWDQDLASPSLQHEPLPGQSEMRPTQSAIARFILLNRQAGRQGNLGNGGAFRGLQKSP